MMWHLPDVQSHGLAVAAHDVRGNPDVVKAAVHADGLTLQFACTTLRADVDVVRSAVEENGLALAYAATQLQGNVDLVLAAVRQNGMALRYATEDVRGVFVVVVAAVFNDGMALAYATPAMRSDPAIVRVAVSSCGAALQFGLGAVRGTQDIVHTAVTRTPRALAFALSPAWSDKDIVLVAVRGDGHAIYDAPAQLRRDRDVVLEALGHWPKSRMSLCDIPVVLQTDPGVLAEVVFWSPMLLEACSEVALDTKRIVLAAYGTVASLTAAPCFARVSERLRDDSDVVWAACKCDVNAYTYASPRMRRDLALARAVVAMRGALIEYVDPSLHTDPEVLVNAVWNDVTAIERV